MSTTATADDVYLEIDTYLGKQKVSKIIDRVSRDLERELEEPPAADTDKRQDLEAVLAALFIATTHDRAEESVQSGRTSVSYEQSLINELRSRAKRLGATDELVGLAGTRRSASITAPDAKNWTP